MIKAVEPTPIFGGSPIRAYQTRISSEPGAVDSCPSAAGSDSVCHEQLNLFLTAAVVTTPTISGQWPNSTIWNNELPTKTQFFDNNLLDNNNHIDQRIVEGDRVDLFSEFSSGFEVSGHTLDAGPYYSLKISPYNAPMLYCEGKIEAMVEGPITKEIRPL